MPVVSKSACNLAWFCVRSLMRLVLFVAWHCAPCSSGCWSSSSRVAWLAVTFCVLSQTQKISFFGAPSAVDGLHCYGLFFRSWLVLGGSRYFITAHKIALCFRLYWFDIPAFQLSAYLVRCPHSNARCFVGLLSLSRLC